MKFDIVKRIKFEYEGWEDCYLEFNLPSYGDLKKLTSDKVSDEEKVENALETIVGLFKGGYAISGGEKVEVTKENVRDFPIEVLTKCFKEISGEVDPK